jgi:DNA-binding transcriptional LysR family regulator
MHLNRFDLNLLVALDALLTERNVTRAAERVFIAQPAMSRALARLRRQFDDPLLVRIGREFRLTPVAEALVEPVRDALLQVQAALGTRPVFEPARSKRVFSLMVPDFVAPLLMPSVLRTLMTESETVKVRLENWSSTGPERLVNGEIDLFVSLDTPRVLGLREFPDSLCRAELMPIRWVCAAASDHPATRKTLTRTEFGKLPQVYVWPPGDTLPVTEAISRQLGVELDLRVVTDNVLGVGFLLPGTRLVAILPEPLAKMLASFLAIRYVALPAGLLQDRRVELFWHRRSEPDPGHAWFRDLVRRSVQQT